MELTWISTERRLDKDNIPHTYACFNQWSIILQIKGYVKYAFGTKWISLIDYAKWNNDMKDNFKMIYLDAKKQFVKNWEDKNLDLVKSVMITS